MKGKRLSLRVRCNTVGKKGQTVTKDWDEFGGGQEGREEK